MAQLWGGRFTRGIDQDAFAFNASLQFDQRLYQQDIEGSIAHARMLGTQKILTTEETKQLTEGLMSILIEMQQGNLTVDPSYEDIHSFIEAELIRRVGDVGKKLHTGRSRNDQVALDMRLYTRNHLFATDERIRTLMTTLFHIMKENLQTYLPGFTHLQKAQPTTLAHYYGAYFEMFRRDRLRLRDTYRRMNYCPLGAGALAGTTYPLDREQTARHLGFYGPTRNSMDSVSDRDFLLEYLADLSILMMHLSRFCEEIILWNSNEYQFIELDDAYATGSSIMPQKKNPDIAELVRGKTGRVYGTLVSLFTTMKGLPLAYNKDMQEDKELVFDAMDTVIQCLALFEEMLRTTTYRKDKMQKSASQGFTNATDAADYLVNHGIPFRDAHEIIGKAVLLCIEKDLSLEQLPLEEWKALCPAFEVDLYEAISMQACVERRNTIGGPGTLAMLDFFKQCETEIKREGFLEIPAMDLLSNQDLHSHQQEKESQ
ncbi:MAG: argininosuccinate lyase [Lachnospiraceae bacterium]|nr:argininosuccinate lyase [Lachnospiraceae bacterium]